MDTRYLKSLIEVIDRGSISDAARVEHLTPAAISQRIQALERELGFALLSRTGHTAQATDACLDILPRARRIVREIELMAGDVDPEGLSGTLRLGAISTALTGLLPSALRTLTRIAPNIRPRVVPGTSSSLYRSLLDGEIDAAIVVAPPFDVPPSLQVFGLRQEPLVLLSKKKARESIRMVLQSHPYIRYDPRSWGGRLAEGYLEQEGLAIDPLFDLDALEAIALLVAQGVGASLVPRWAGLADMATECSITPVAGAAFTRHIVLVAPSRSERPNMLRAFRTALKL